MTQQQCAVAHHRPMIISCPLPDDLCTMQVLAHQKVVFSEIPSKNNQVRCGPVAFSSNHAIACTSSLVSADL